MNFCPLTSFLQWWMQSRALVPPQESIMNADGNITGCVIYRDGEYQVQLFIVQPNSVIEPHIHPNVDSFEVYVSGDIAFSINGTLYSQSEVSEGKVLRVRPNDWHGGVFGPRGGVFLSVQRWENGVSPTSVGDDWQDKQGNTKGKSVSLGAAIA